MFILLIHLLLLGVILSFRFPTIIPKPPSELKRDLNFTIKEVVIDGVSYGKPFFLEDLLMLPRDFLIENHLQLSKILVQRDLDFHQLKNIKKC